MKQQGFTLIEMMAVITIAAILFAVGVPSFDAVIKRNNIESLQMKLASAVSTARSEAASRNAMVSMCASNNATSCSGTWSDGWITFEDNNTDGVLDNTEIVIDVYEHATAYTISAEDSGGTSVALMTFSQQGYMQGTTATLFTLCEPDKDVSYAKGLFVSASGLMLKTVDTADGDSSHDNPFDAGDTDPDDLSC